MPELIDKAAAYNALKHEAETHGLSFSAEAYDRAARIIDQMPTIEPEVRHGRWIEHGGGIVATCSNCYATYHKDVLQSISPYAEHLTRHCPNCGARMDGGADNG